MNRLEKLKELLQSIFTEKDSETLRELYAVYASGDVVGFTVGVCGHVRSRVHRDKSILSTHSAALVSYLVHVLELGLRSNALAAAACGALKNVFSTPPLRERYGDRVLYALLPLLRRPLCEDTARLALWCLRNTVCETPRLAEKFANAAIPSLVRIAERYKGSEEIEYQLSWCFANLVKNNNRLRHALALAVAERLPHTGGWAAAALALCGDELVCEKKGEEICKHIVEELPLCKDKETLITYFRTLEKILVNQAGVRAGVYRGVVTAATGLFADTAEDDGELRTAIQDCVECFYDDKFVRDEFPELFED